VVGFTTGSRAEVPGKKKRKPVTRNDDDDDDDDNNNNTGTGVAQSVWCLTTDWTTGVQSPTEIKHFSSSLCVQTSSDAHPASYPMGTGGSFPQE
jgi:hypothetical protein